jgi:hypothetical protein
MEIMVYLMVCLVPLMNARTQVTPVRLHYAVVLTPLEVAVVSDSTRTDTEIVRVGNLHNRLALNTLIKHRLKFKLTISKIQMVKVYPIPILD